MDIGDDPRFLQGIDLFNEGEFLEASDLFEELFFELSGGEADFARLFLQFSVGIHHAQMGQRRPAVERIEEGLRLARLIGDHRGFDLARLNEAMRSVVAEIRARGVPVWPKIERTR